MITLPSGKLRLGHRNKRRVCAKRGFAGRGNRVRCTGG